jgi:alkyl hydroperoxide reductase subunit AhpF
MNAGPMLGEREQGAIREAFAAIERDLDVTLELGPVATPVTLLAGGGREIDPAAITRQLVTEVCALGSLQHSVTSSSSRIRLMIVEHEEAGPWPRTTIGSGLVYQGMPIGYELTTLVHAIVEAGRATPALSASSLERLEALDADVAIDVYVTPT